MVKNFLLGAIILFTLGCKSTTPVVNESFDDSNKTAILAGHNLYKSFLHYKPDEKPTTLELKTTQVLSKYICDDVQYIPVTVETNAQKIISVYYIANNELEKGVQFGRHYRVDYDPESYNISTIDFSTKGCVLIPNEKRENEEVAALFITHILSESPSEFHVFLSYLHNKPIYVGTSVGTWKVDKNSIEKM